MAMRAGWFRCGWASWVVLLWVSLALGCSDEGERPVQDAGPVVPDLTMSPNDGGTDTGPADVSGEDAAASGCRSDGDCTEPGASRCDEATGQCVGCVTNADCPMREMGVCDEDTKQCRPCGGLGSTDCGPGRKCVPWSQGAAFCIAEGTANIGEACTSTEDCVGLETICAGGVCFRPDCTPTKLEETCSGSRHCAALPIANGQDWADAGRCLGECEAFNEELGLTGGCPAGRWCHPEGRLHSRGTFYGGCFNFGDLDIGQRGCTASGCRPGLSCVDDMCEVPCDPLSAEVRAVGQGGCNQGTICKPFFLADGSTTALGFCGAGCDPLTPESGCGAGETCLPSLYAPYLGSCRALGTRVEGDACTARTDCGHGLECFDGRCTKICYPLEESPNPDTACAAGQACLTNINYGGLLSQFGLCVKSCNIVTQDCPSPGEACIDARLVALRAGSSSLCPGDSGTGAR